jgi:hypothetical protein
MWSDINILKVIPVTSPDGRIILEQHPVYCPPVYVGLATAPEKYHVILKFAHGFLRYPDPFSITIDEEDTHAKALGVLSSATLPTTIVDPCSLQGKNLYEHSRKPTSMCK